MEWRYTVFVFGKVFEFSVFLKFTPWFLKPEVYVFTFLVPFGTSYNGSPAKRGELGTGSG